MNPSPSRRRRAASIAASAAALVITAGALASCGSDPRSASDQVASLSSEGSSSDAATSSDPDGSRGSESDTPGTTSPGSTSSDSTTPDSVDPQEAFLDYTQCMRDEGIDLPDPQVFSAGAGGGVVAGGGPQSIDIATGAAPGGSAPGGPLPDIDPDSDEFKAAEATCKPILDAVTSQIDVDPEVVAEQREQMLDFARCMREHGVDFPDPTFGDDGTMTVQIGKDDDGGVEPPDPDVFQAANEACAQFNVGAIAVASGSAEDGGE